MALGGLIHFAYNHPSAANSSAALAMITLTGFLDIDVWPWQSGQFRLVQRIFDAIDEATRDTARRHSSSRQLSTEQRVFGDFLGKASRWTGRSKVSAPIRCILIGRILIRCLQA